MRTVKRRQVDQLQQAIKAAKRRETIERKYGPNAFSTWGKQRTPNLEAASRGGKKSPTNFKNNKELASYAGRQSKRTSGQ